MILTEGQAQCALARHWFKKRVVMLPNFFLGNNEADFVVVTQAHMTYEYEVKCSRGDFLRELSAITGNHNGHAQSLPGLVTETHCQISTSKWYKHQQYQHLINSKVKTIARGNWVPNYYYLAVKQGICTNPDILALPAYVGVLELIPSDARDDTKPWQCRELRPAARMHPGHVTEAWLLKYCRGMSLRYWQWRMSRKAKRTHSPCDNGNTTS